MCILFVLSAANLGQATQQGKGPIKVTNIGSILPKQLPSEVTEVVLLVDNEAATPQLREQFGEIPVCMDERSLLDVIQDAQENFLAAIYPKNSGQTSLSAYQAEFKH